MEKLIEEEKEEEIDNRYKHWFWDNWIFLALGAAVFLTIRSMTMGEIALLGFEGVLYLSTGPVVYGIGYFIYQKEWALINNPKDKDN